MGAAGRMGADNARPDYEMTPEVMEKMLRVRDELMAEVGDPGPIIGEDQSERGWTWWTPTRVYGSKPWKREMRSFPRNPPAPADGVVD